MTLARKIEKAAFEKLHEAIQGEYELVNGEYFLQTSGLVPKEKHDEFRDNNIALKTEIEKLKMRNDLFGDMTEAELKALKVKAEKTGEAFTDEEKKKLVDEEVSKRIVKLNEENKKVVDALQEKNTGLNINLEKVLIDTKLQTAAIKAGIKKEALSDFVARGKNVYKIVEGKETPMDGENILYGKDGQTPLSVDEWAAGLSSEAPHLFKANSGDGGRHQHQKMNNSGNQNLVGASRMAAARQTD